MDDETDNDANTSRRRPMKSTRLRAPSVSRASRRRKTKTASATVGGRHQRRNKHWNW